MPLNHTIAFCMSSTARYRYGYVEMRKSIPMHQATNFKEWPYRANISEHSSRFLSILRDRKQRDVGKGANEDHEEGWDRGGGWGDWGKGIGRIWRWWGVIVRNKGGWHGDYLEIGI